MKLHLLPERTHTLWLIFLSLHCHPTDEEHEEHMQEMQGVLYKEAVGSLMYAMVATRADIAFAMSVVSQFMSKPSSMHWAAVKRILRYLKGTWDVKLCLGGMDLTMKGCCDAVWASPIVP